MFNEIGLVSIRRILAAISGKYPRSFHFHTKRWHCGSVTEHVSEISLQHDRGCRLLPMHGYKKWAITSISWNITPAWWLTPRIVSVLVHPNYRLTRSLSHVNH